MDVTPGGSPGCAPKRKAKQSKAKWAHPGLSSQARPCGYPNQSKAKQSKAMQSKAKQNTAKRSNAKQSKAKQCKQSNAKQSKAKPSNAKQSKEREERRKEKIVLLSYKLISDFA